MNIICSGKEVILNLDRAKINNEAARKVILALFRYRIMTTNQLALLLSYKVEYIHNVMSMLNTIVPRMRRPFNWKTTKVYYLDKKIATWAADALKEPMPGQWEDPPNNMVQILTANQFVCKLIRSTLNNEAAGIMEWFGPGAASEKYAVFDPDKEDKKSLPIKPDAYGIYHPPGKEELVIFHIEALTGEELAPYLEDKVKTYLQTLKEYWGREVSQVSILFLCLDLPIMNLIRGIWNNLADRVIDEKPMFGVALYHEVIDGELNEEAWYLEDGSKVPLSYFAKFNGSSTHVRYIGKEKKQIYPSFIKKKPVEDPDSGDINWL